MPAPIIKPECSLSTVLDEACFTHARVEANPLTLAYAADFNAFFVEWHKCNEQEIKLRTTLVRRNALIAACDDELDQIADATNQAVLLQVKSDRTSALYLLYFGAQTLSQLKRPILSDQLEKMRSWIPSLTTSTNAVLCALGARLAKAVAAADAAVAARLMAEQQNRDFRAVGQRKVLIDSLNSLRKALYGKLSELPHAQPDLHLPAGFAEEFYRHESARKADTVMTVDELKLAITASNQKTAQHEADLAQALAYAAQTAKEKADRDEAIAALALADQARAAAAARVAAFSDKKKT